MGAGPTALGRGPRRIGAAKAAWSWPVGGSLPATANPQGPPATRFLPRLIQHKAQARNGMLPEMTYARKLASALNHILAYRRKTFFTFGDYANRMTGAAGTTNKWRFRCHTGFAARYLTIQMGMGLADTAIGTPTDPRAEVVVTDVSNGDVITYTAHHGLNAGGDTDDNPQQITQRTIRAVVKPNTTYAVLIRCVDYGRVLDVDAFEEAALNIDPEIDYFIDSGAIAVGAPIYDVIREQLLVGFSQVWRRNGPQLLTIPGLGTAGAGFVTTTFTNVIDDTTTVPSDATPGFHLGDGSFTLEQLARLTANKTVNVILAAYGSCSTASGTGEVRLQDASGTRCSLTGIGTTEQWWTTPTTIADLDTLAKVDVQARTTDVAAPLTLHAVSLYAYLT